MNDLTTDNTPATLTLTLTRCQWLGLSVSMELYSPMQEHALLKMKNMDPGHVIADRAIQGAIASIVPQIREKLAENIAGQP